MLGRVVVYADELVHPIIMLACGKRVARSGEPYGISRLLSDLGADLAQACRVSATRRADYGQQGIPIHQLAPHNRLLSR